MKLKVGLIVVATLLLFEVYVRVFVVSPAVVYLDAELGPMKAPFSHILRTYEGHGEYTTDNYGFNNGIVLHDDLPKVRILVLGDSFVEAKHIPRVDNFVERLNALPDTWAYNVGYSGADPRSFPVLVPRFLSVVQPTQLVLCVNADDLTALQTSRLPAYAPPTGLKAWLQPLFAHSALATHLNWKYKPVFQTWWQTWMQSEQPKKQPKRTYDDTIFAANWASILQQITAYKVPVLLVAFPKLHYEGGEAKAVYDARLETLINTAQHHDVAVLRLEDVLIQDFAKTGKVAFGFMNSHLGTGHLNAHGHAVVADAIAKKLGLQP